MPRLSKKDLEPFDSFWEASTYSQFNIREFASAQEKYSGKEKLDSLLEYPDEPSKLTLPKTVANRLAKRRKSDRQFSKKTMSKRELGIVLSSFYAINGLEHRTYPSAGASYALEVFCVANNVTGFSNKVLYYNPDIHAVNVIGKAPSWKEMSEKVNVSITGTPQCLIILVLLSNRLTSKYLERGGRFALIEAGAAMQQLVIQIAGSKKLMGVAAGGLIDDYWANLLGLSKSEAKIALGYLCGK